MNRFKNILLVCDEKSVHEEVLQRTAWLAKANDAQVCLVDAIDTAPGELAGLFGALPGARAYDLEFEVLEFHRARLGRIAAGFRAEGIITTEFVLQGVPFVEIVRKVLRDGHDLVIKSAAGEAESGSLFFASMDLHLLRKCPCPVWVMQGQGQPTYRRILAAVDPDPNDDRRDSLNRLIMDLATSLSRKDGSQFDLIHAWNLESEDTLRNSGMAKFSRREVDLLVEERRKRNQAMLDRLLQRYPESQPTREVHMVKGPARQVIPEFAQREGVDLIVMGTVGRTGIRGLFIGNTAEAILNQVRCSVLAVKPPGFESPVQLEEESVPLQHQFRHA